MTRDRARKKAIRTRMAAGREPYSVAARRVRATSPAVAVGEIIARADRTLAEPGARFELRTDHEWPEQPPRPRPGPLGRLVRRGGRAARRRIAPDVDAATLREMFKHSVGVGFLEPAARRYQIDFGNYAQMFAVGQLYGGASGATVQARHRDRHTRPAVHDPLGLLTLLHGTTEAQVAGHEEVRGTPCRVVAVRAGSTELTVWIDDQHVRRVRFTEHGPAGPASLTRTVTLELWDFGPPAEPLDWSRLPSFPRPE